ncbi:hypothetical protein H8I91_25105 [Serratia fonticola]|uniref:hypothetical protein n=1 Tax=Serratia fonticola TaxID=47917 RepID=UPI00164502A0|nr:hypothetical protein [Serratia fonticola]MBC3253547.1 hypothetical protein [Serratia fonticola]
MQDKGKREYTVYTIQSNNILSKNMALECILVKFLDGDNEQGKGRELLDAALSLILEQAEEIDSFRSICDRADRFGTELLRIASKNVGAVAMTERLIEDGDECGDLGESLLALIQNQFIDIQRVRERMASL